MYQFTCEPLHFRVFFFLISDVVVVWDLNKHFGRSMDLAEKKRGTDRRICIPLFTYLIYAVGKDECMARYILSKTKITYQRRVSSPRENLNSSQLVSTRPSWSRSSSDITARSRLKIFPKDLTLS